MRWIVVRSAPSTARTPRLARLSQRLSLPWTVCRVSAARNGMSVLASKAVRYEGGRVLRRAQGGRRKARDCYAYAYAYVIGTVVAETPRPVH